MEKRHVAERLRDEERISRMKSKGRTEAAGERSRKQFNLGGDEKAALYLSATPPVKSLKTDHRLVVKAKPSRQGYSRSYKGKTVDTGIFAVLAEGLQLVTGTKKQTNRSAFKVKPADTGIFAVLAEGLQLILGPKKPNARKKQTLGGLLGPKPPLSTAKDIHDQTNLQEGPVLNPDEIAQYYGEQNVAAKKEPELLSSQLEIGQLYASDQTAIQDLEKNNQYTNASLEGGDEYEARVASLVVELEGREKKQRNRRKRKRPRGKVRKMD